MQRKFQEQFNLRSSPSKFFFCNDIFVDYCLLSEFLYQIIKLAKTVVFAKVVLINEAALQSSLPESR